MKNPLNQQIANGIDISSDGMYSGLELKKDSLECVEIISVEDFSGLDYTETRF